jgi:hypothetical protein
VNNLAGTKKQSASDPVSERDRYSSLIERLVKEEIEQRERGLLADWRTELSALRTGHN